MTDAEELDSMVAGMQIAYKIVYQEKEKSKNLLVQTSLHHVMKKIEAEIEKYASKEKVQRIITL